MSDWNGAQRDPKNQCPVRRTSRRPREPPGWRYRSDIPESNVKQQCWRVERGHVRNRLKNRSTGPGQAPTQTPAIWWVAHRLAPTGTYELQGPDGITRVGEGQQFRNQPCARSVGKTSTAIRSTTGNCSSCGASIRNSLIPASRYRPTMSVKASGEDQGSAPIGMVQP